MPLSEFKISICEQGEAETCAEELYIIDGVRAWAREGVLHISIFYESPEVLFDIRGKIKNALEGNPELQSEALLQIDFLLSGTGEDSMLLQSEKTKREIMLTRNKITLGELLLKNHKEEQSRNFNFLIWIHRTTGQIISSRQQERMSPEEALEFINVQLVTTRYSAEDSTGEIEISSYDVRKVHELLPEIKGLLLEAIQAFQKTKTLLLSS